MIVPWTFDHLLFVARNLDPGQIAERMALSWADEYVAEDVAVETWQSAAFGHALIVDRMPHTVCGYSYPYPGVARSFLLSRTGFYPVALTRHARKVMAALLDEGETRRLETLSMATHIPAHRWFGLLGLKPEGAFERMGRNGEDFIMFARV